MSHDASAGTLITVPSDRRPRNAENGQFVSGPSMTHKRYKIARTSVLLPDHNVLIAAGAERAELLHFPTLTFREVAGHYPGAMRLRRRLRSMTETL